MTSPFFINKTAKEKLKNNETRKKERSFKVNSHSSDIAMLKGLYHSKMGLDIAVCG